jgi:RHS repeat-associated protein
MIGPTYVSDSYDFENRLVNRNNGQVTITYDGDGNRVSKTVGGVTTLFVVDELNPTGYAQVLEELTVLGNGAEVTRINTFGHGILAQDHFDGTNWIARFYGADGHGNVRYLTDAVAQITDTYNYEAFGTLLQQFGTTDNHYLFTGEQFDPELDLYYLRARYQNTDSGRFWTLDSFEGFQEDPGSLHKYTYAANCPVSLLDRSGNYSVAETTLASAMWAPAREIFGAITGALSGSLIAGYDSILHGKVSNQEIAQAMTIGFEEGARIGAFLGGVSAFGAVGAFGASAVGLIYSGLGFLAAYQDYDAGYEEAGDFKVALSVVGGVFSAVGTTRALSRVYSPQPYVPKPSAQWAQGKSASEISVHTKLHRYLLNPTHAEGGPKAKWFREALGFTQSNRDRLASQIVFNERSAIPTSKTRHGQKYEQSIQITGENGRRIDVLFIWNRGSDGVPKLVTALPTKK